VTIAVTELDDGLTVVTETMGDVRSVSLGFWVGTGSVDEVPEQSGASHFLEHLLFKGTPRRSARQIAEAVDEVGGDMNAFTTKEYTAFYVRMLAEGVDLALDILSDIIWDPSFRSDEVDSERQVILEEILMHGDEPADLVHDVFAASLWPGHPLGREVLGDEGTVAALGPEQIAAFHHHHYRPGNLVVAVAGNVSHQAVVDGVAARRREVTGGAAPERTAPVVAAGAEVVEVRPTEQAHLVVGVAGPDREAETRHAAGILDHVLGGGMSSRLFQTIREERGLAYSVYSYRMGFAGAGAFAVYAGTSPANTGQVLDLIHAELDRVAEKGITSLELAAAQSHLRGARALGLEDSGARMSRIGYSQLVHGRVPEVEEVDRRMEAVTLDEVNALAAELFASPRTVAAVGPFESGLR
jgi:predicted Zn-dependent peptidase